MKMLEKIIDCKSLGISEENVYDGVYFSNATNLQCTDCNSAIRNLHHRFFLQYAPKTSCLKRNTWRKNFLSNKPTILSKMELMLELSVETLKILMYLPKNHLGGGFFSVKF